MFELQRLDQFGYVPQVSHCPISTLGSARFTPFLNFLNPNSVGFNPFTSSASGSAAIGVFKSVLFGPVSSYRTCHGNGDLEKKTWGMSLSTAATRLSLDQARRYIVGFIYDHRREPFQ